MECILRADFAKTGYIYVSTPLASCRHVSKSLVRAASTSCIARLSSLFSFPACVDYDDQVAPAWRLPFSVIARCCDFDFTKVPAKQYIPYLFEIQLQFPPSASKTIK